MTDRSRPPLILFILGKKPKASSLLPGVFARLDALGIRHRVHLPHDDRDPRQSPAGVDLGPDGLSGQIDLVVHRGLDEDALALVDELSVAGLDCVDPPGAVRAVAHHDVLAARLADAGVGVPASVPAQPWAGVHTAAHAAPGPVVVKRQQPDTGRGAEVISGTAAELPQRAPFPGPFSVEAFIPNDGFDRKLYVVGTQVRGLLKPSPLRVGHTTEGTPFTPDTATAAAALHAARSCGLSLCGVDVLPSDEGPMVIDINPFPGYRDVADAELLIADHLASRVRRGQEQQTRTRRYPHMDETQPSEPTQPAQAAHDLSDAAIGDPTAYLPEKSTWVADQLRAIDAAGDTAAATIQERPVMVITMRGARSGMLRRVPLMRVEHDGAYAAVASKGGAPEHPDWFHNLLKNRDVLVQDGTSQQPLRARLLDDGAERNDWWQRCVEAFPTYADYQQNTERQIPVFLLETPKGQ